MSYIEFKNRWNGKSTDQDGVYGKQCVDLTLAYISECYGINGAYGNAIDWWAKTDNKLYARFDRIATTDCQQGDIVILRTSGRTDHSGDGHIGIADAQDGGNVWLLEQNAVGTATGTGRDAIGVYRAISKTRIAGVLRPKPATPPPQAPLYTVEAILPRQVQVNSGSKKWNLGHGSFNDVANNPITVADNNTIFTATAVLHHREIPQYNYYLEDGNTPHGYNVLDCNDYIAPPPPYVPPARPVAVKKAETINFMVDMMCYPSLIDARMKTNVNLEVDIQPNTSYYVQDKTEKYLKISDNNMIDRDWWINMDDNKLPVVEVPEVVPEVIQIITKPIEALPAVQTVAWFWYNDDQQPTIFRYKGFNPATIRNLNDHNDTLNLPPNAQGPISRYAMINGNTYLIPDSEFKKGKLYGIYKELMEEVEDRPIRQVLDTNDDGKINVYDLAFIMTPAKDLYTKALPVIVKSQVFIKTNGKQFVDGFSRRRK